MKDIQNYFRNIEVPWGLQNYYRIPLRRKEKLGRYHAERGYSSSKIALKEKKMQSQRHPLSKDESPSVTLKAYGIQEKHEKQRETSQHCMDKLLVNAA